ncbi:helix-turn-helix domain-containing protein [Escherichia coli]|uniref:helix-turn-helix domain-containing protein n=1 Tax=Escherichia coli TaxID=562 RepID=UPI00067B6EA0|nr:helix-turn-helix transcriptional regulator [Escherichia coli]EFN7277955.1 XRE family transcriptional regulator [Escherichia coli O11:H5]MCZ8689326.1 helix-turn-helix transcriptional regulator [Escherichia albertii]EEZ6655757.1 helix-turn-helix transcriptional regulator [Escherichia coli]EFN9925010.1 XRE family transcriptional regulator [Escherichia coli]EGB1671329.1 helix-turn-helix transcriptional regulator [Escherichia coli]
MSDIGDRLKEVRERMGLNQTDFAKLANHGRSVQAGYEQGKNIPGGAYLAALAAAGVDILYVLTGQKTPDIKGISDEELELVKIYRAAPLAVKAAALGALTAGSAKSDKLNVTGDGNRIAGRDYHEGKK